MKMTKTASLMMLVLSTLATGAHAGKQGAVASASGTLTTVSDTEVSIAIANPDVRAALSALKPLASITDVTIKSSKDGKLWLAPAEQDAAGTGVMHSTDGETTIYYGPMDNTGAWQNGQSEEHKNLVYTKQPAKAGVGATIHLAIAGRGYPVPTQPGKYMYTLNGGMWID